MRYILVFLTIISVQTLFSQGLKSANTITFYAKDSVAITADGYFLNDVQPTVLLCHQAGFSRGEYIDTARRLNDLGFSCLAIDQRSGKEVNGLKNRTAMDANAKGVNVGYAGAKQDLEAAIDYLYGINGNKPIIMVGSSYSASLALWIGTENKKVKAIAAFSPGEYLTGKNLAEMIRSLDLPTFVTSSQRETGPVEKLMRHVDGKNVTHFKPNVKGVHGSRALWSTTKGNEDYWKAFKTFILANK